MTCQMQLCVFILIICFLENSYVIYAAFMQISVFIAVERIDFYAYNLKVLACLLAGLANVMHVTHFAAFTCENENFLLAGSGDGLHFGSNLLAAQAGALNFIMAVEAAVNAVIFAVVGDIQRRKKGDVIAEVTLALDLCGTGNLLQKRQSGRRKQGREVLGCTLAVSEGCKHVCFRIFIIIVSGAGSLHLIENIGVDNFHALLILHRVG